MRHKEPYMASLKTRDFSYSDPAQNTEDSSFSDSTQNTEDSSYSNPSQSTDDFDEKPKQYLEKIKKEIDVNELNKILSDNEVREIEFSFVFFLSWFFFQAYFENNNIVKFQPARQESSTLRTIAQVKMATYFWFEFEIFVFSFVQTIFALSYDLRQKLKQK